MTPGNGIDRAILTIDLRGVDPATLTGRHFADVLAGLAPGGDGQRVDFGRVVLLDQAKDLTAHDDIYAHILDSHVDVSMLCLAVGPPTADDLTVAVRRPYQVGPPKAATLWIGDVHGIGWRTGSTLADSVNIPPGGAAPGAADRVPHELIEILSLPQVFDRVVEVVTTMPGAAACPGFRIVRGDIPPEVLADAQRSAIREFTTMAAAPVELPLAATASTAGGQLNGRASEVIKPGGRVDELYQRCRRTGQQALAVMRRVSRPERLLTAEGANARGALSKFADALTDLTDLVDWTLDHVDTRTGFDRAHRQDLRDLGVEIGEPPITETTRSIEVLTERALAVIDQCQPLPAIAERLRDESDKLVPRGTATYRDRLRRICPANLIALLRKPPAVITGVPPAPALGTTFAACLICGIWPVPAGLFGGLSVLAAGGVAAMGISRAARVSAASRVANLWFLVGFMVAAVAGAGCGVGLSFAARLSAPDGIGGTVIGLVITIVAMWLIGYVSWRALASRWWAALHVTRMFGIPDLVRGLVADVARNEWQEATARATISDHARALAGVLDDAAEAIKSHAINPPGPGAKSAHRGASRQRLDHDQISQELVLIDLAAAIAAIVERLAVANGAVGLASIDSLAVKHEVASLLDVYQGHIAASGLPEPPPFARPSERRGQLVESLVERGTELRDAIRTVATDERITQLCAPHQLTLLETDTRNVELIRFAPRSAEEFLDQRGPTTGLGHPVIWTRASSIAGVLRLAPLRASAVQSIMPKAPGTARPANGGSWLAGGQEEPAND